jgi:putative phosphotransacetylase
MGEGVRTCPVALSARHVHLSKEHVEALFGPGRQLTPQADLSQPGQFAARETVEVVGPKRSLPGIRVLGPPRGRTQVELSISDGFLLGLNLPTRMSGDLQRTPGAHLIGPAGAVRLTEGCISAVRHLHATPRDAQALGLKDGQRIYVRFPGARGLIFDSVVVRVSEASRLELHLDTDEGNAAGIRSGDPAEVIGSLCRDACGKPGCPIAPAMREGSSRPFCDFTSGGMSIR